MHAKLVSVALVLLCLQFASARGPRRGVLNDGLFWRQQHEQNYDSGDVEQWFEQVLSFSDCGACFEQFSNISCCFYFFLLSQSRSWTISIQPTWPPGNKGKTKITLLHADLHKLKESKQIIDTM